MSSHGRITVGDNRIVDGSLFDPELSTQARKELGRRFGTQFFRQLKEIAGNDFINTICFLDVVGVVPPGRSRGFVLAPSERHAAAYLDSVKKLLESGHAIAGHPVFDAGMPLITIDAAAGREQRSIDTERQLNDLLRELKTGNASVPSDHGYYVARLTGSGTDALSPDATGVTREIQLFCAPLDYEESSPDAARARYGREDRNVYENLEEFVRLLTEQRTTLVSSTGIPIDNFYAVPLTYWTRDQSGAIGPVRVGSFFLGTSGNLLDRQVFGMIEVLVFQTFGIALRAQMARGSGITETIARFAHQTSAAVHALVEDVRIMSDRVQHDLGDLFIAKLNFLHAVVNSYRDARAQAPLGEFPYPWRDENPLAVYRNIGIQFGLARATMGNDQDLCVRDVGYELNSPFRTADTPLDWSNRFFESIPKWEGAVEMLKHSSSAVLIILAIQQAVYHTIRAQCSGQKDARVKVRLTSVESGHIFGCEIENAEFDETDRDRTAKDAVELERLAQAFNSAPSPYIFSTKGPKHTTTKAPNSNKEQGKWLTRVTIHSKPRP